MSESPLHLSPSCRILALSSSLERAVSFVQQIRSLSGHVDDSETISEEGVPDAASASKESTSNDKYIPWTISNKYYSANVHFLARAVKGLAPFQLRSAPAVIFVWEKGEAYKHHVIRLAQDLEGAEPDVSLAVRVLGKTVEESSSEDPEDAQFEEFGEIDEFLSSKGFEFVDAAIRDISGDNDDDFSPGDIPSLPRVLDALSTIMWPSMQTAARKPKVKPCSSKPGPDTMSSDWAQSSFDQYDTDLPINEDDLVVPQNESIGLAGQARIKKEIAELVRWLEDDDYTVSKDDPWSHSSQSQMMVSPTSEEESHETRLNVTNPDGFDDDFTVFVSTPPVEGPSDTSAEPGQRRSDSIISSNPTDSEGFPNFAKFGDSSFAVAETWVDSLAPPDSHAGLMYHSLGSASDLGEHGESSFQQVLSDEDEEDEEDEGGLPTKDEIRMSAARIFGPGTRSDVGGESEFADRDDDYDMTPFDLSNVSSVLQGMKEEISGMNDETERRRAAASVALGLVYGLDRNQREGSLDL